MGAKEDLAKVLYEEGKRQAKKVIRQKADEMREKHFPTTRIGKAKKWIRKKIK